MNSPLELLQSAFTLRGIISCSATDTDEGTNELWGALEGQGLVARNAHSPMGHRFSMRLTDAGRKLLGASFSPYDHPFFCVTCRNSFNNLENLVTHRRRKHSQKRGAEDQGARAPII
jgi:hypothetical protein